MSNNSADKISRRVIFDYTSRESKYVQIRPKWFVSTRLFKYTPIRRHQQIIDCIRISHTGQAIGQLPTGAILP